MKYVYGPFSGPKHHMVQPGAFGPHWYFDVFIKAFYSGITCLLHLHSYVMPCESCLRSSAERARGPVDST